MQVNADQADANKGVILPAAFEASKHSEKRQVLAESSSNESGEDDKNSDVIRKRKSRAAEAKAPGRTPFVASFSFWNGTVVETIRRRNCLDRREVCSPPFMSALSCRD